MITIPLKAKYLVQRGQTKCGSYKARTGNSHGTKKHSVLWFLNKRMKGTKTKRG